MTDSQIDHRFVELVRRDIDDVAAEAGSEFLHAVSGQSPEGLFTQVMYEVDRLQFLDTFTRLANGRDWSADVSCIDLAVTLYVGSREVKVTLENSALSDVLVELGRTNDAAALTRMLRDADLDRALVAVPVALRTALHELRAIT